MNYYNEFDPKAAAWLRELIKDGHIPRGEVDERSIKDVQPGDLRRFTQCHFFAGIGGWSRALELAGWPSNRPVWTGSCPCQPFSAAGKRKGKADDRHLWPEFFRLIRECRPDTIFGEQVAAAVGSAWLDDVSTDLEGEGYAVGAIVLPACGVGAPHKRERLWFVGDSRRARTRRHTGAASCKEAESTGSRDIGGVWDHEPHASSSGLVHTFQQGLEGHSGDGGGCERWTKTPRPTTTAGAVNGFWADAEWINCTDGKARPTKPGIFPLADGVPGRVGLLRGYGNAIVPQAAAEVIGAFMKWRTND